MSDSLQSSIFEMLLVRPLKDAYEIRLSCPLYFRRDIFVIKESYIQGIFTSSSLEDPDSGDQDEVMKLLFKTSSSAVRVALWIPAV